MIMNNRIFNLFIFILCVFFFISCQSFEKHQTPEKHKSAIETNCKGIISKEIVAKMVNGKMDLVLSCYENALIENPKIEGKIVYEWYINSSGKVETVDILYSNVKSKNLEQCIKNTIKTYNYKILGDGCNAQIRYPFVFDVKD